MNWLAHLSVSIATIFSVYGNAQIPGLAPQKGWDLSGYIKQTGSVNAVEGNTFTDSLTEQRFNYERRFNHALHFNAGMRNRLLWGDSAKLPGYAELISGDPGYLDLSTNWLDEDGRIANTQLDRLYFDYSDNGWQLRAGRFRINWGMTTLWSPNDLFSAYSVYDVDYPERAGSDALSVQRQLGFASSVDVVYNPAQNSALDSYAARYLFNLQGWDWQLLAGKSGLDYLLAGGLAGDLKGAGLRAEMTWFHPRQDQWQALPLQSSFLVSLESDYSFAGTGNWVGRLAALYISHPQQAESTLNYLNLPLTARTLSFAKLTCYAELGFDLSALSRLTFSGSYYSDGSFFSGLNSSYSLANNWQVLLVVQRFNGSGSSLFGETPSAFAFAQVKWSF